MIRLFFKFEAYFYAENEAELINSALIEHNNGAQTGGGADYSDLNYQS